MHTIGTRFLGGILLATIIGCAAGAETAPPPMAARLTLAWDADWRFSKGEFAAAMVPIFDDAGWRTVRVPHDWSTEEPYRADYSSGNGYAAGGIGWYRKHFKSDAAWVGKVVTVEFDGIYANAEIWLNGQYLGGRPYGYSSFALELTGYLKSVGENVLAVRVDHSRFADSRWYTGSGIYRHVRLVVTNPLRVAHWGTFVTTPDVTAAAATVRVETTACNATTDGRTFTVQSDIMDPAGAVVASATAAGSVSARAAGTVVQAIHLPGPRRWSLESPTLYTLRTRIVEGTSVVDETRTTFGVRTIAFDSNQGFALNGVALKLKGVCVHHDAGSLGAAVPDAVWERRLRILKQMGVNAIRTSHNPPAPELLDLCDRIGLLVKDEALDEFTPTKKKWIAGWTLGQPGRFGAGEFFAEWGVRDVADMVRRDRNHPSIILWSIGNEVDYPNDPFSHPVLGKRYQPSNPPAENLVTCAVPLVAAVKELDRTRPVTAALASIAMSNAVGLPEKLDVVGYNYQEANYAADHAQYPKRVIFGSENYHSFAAWLAVRDNPYVAGQFLWTGIDYLGEAGMWPNRANGAGLLDLCGFKKPEAWFRESLWSERAMVYIGVLGPPQKRRLNVIEHWNWPVNSSLAVTCYSNCEEVELTLNGKSLGTKRATAAVEGVLTWDVSYAPGVLKAIGRNGGQEVCTHALETAGAATRLELVIDEYDVSHADVRHVEFRIVDARGIRVPDATQEVSIEVTGPAELLGLGNGDLNNIESGRDASHAAYQGRGVAILRRTGASDVTLRATAPGLEPATLTLHHAQ